MERLLTFRVNVESHEDEDGRTHMILDLETERHKEGKQLLAEIGKPLDHETTLQVFSFIVIAVGREMAKASNFHPEGWADWSIRKNSAG